MLKFMASISPRSTGPVSRPRITSRESIFVRPQLRDVEKDIDIISRDILNEDNAYCLCSKSSNAYTVEPGFYSWESIKEMEMNGVAVSPYTREKIVGYIKRTFSDDPESSYKKTDILPYTVSSEVISVDSNPRDDFIDQNSLRDAISDFLIHQHMNPPPPTRRNSLSSWWASLSLGLGRRPTRINPEILE